MSNLIFNNVSLYIKRAESHLSSNFIINAFNNNNIGIVREVKFIKKSDNSGKEYHGVIVIFERWFTNSKVNKLLDDMNNSEDGSIKFTYDKYGHYWYINIYTTCVLPEAQQQTLIESSLPDKQRIIALENLLQNMTTQMHYMQTRNEYNERQLMEYEQKQTRHYLCNVEIRSLLEDKEFELEEAKNAYNRELYAHLEEISMLKSRLACLSGELVKKKQNKNNNNNNKEMCDIPNMSKMTLEELN